MDFSIQDASAHFEKQLIESGAVSQNALERAIRACDKTGERLEIVLAQLGIASEIEISKILAKTLSVPFIQLKDFPQEQVLPEALPFRFLQANKILPLKENGTSVRVATSDPFNRQAIEALAYHLDCSIDLCVATTSDIEKGLGTLYHDQDSETDDTASSAQGTNSDNLTDDDVSRLRDLASEAPIIKLVNTLISDAVHQNASDIHVEPQDDGVSVRYRTDGMLHTARTISPDSQAAIISRIKIMARLNIAERRLPQDGRIKTSVRGKDIDLRVSTTPTLHGESIVLRILDRAEIKLSFPALGFAPDLTAQIGRLLNRPSGIFLVTGPTGSGKTTTLYAALETLNVAERSLFSVEDPVEYALKGINQIQVQPKIGLSFANILRSVLRQDPDIIMIGEIRDRETAEIAIQAALTGHLVLSTLHTNSAASAITRLLDMGVEAYLLASTISGILGQRLVRCLCDDCAVKHPHPEQFLNKFDSVDASVSSVGIEEIHQPVGCEKCRNTGYASRTSIAELLTVTDEIRELILASAPENELNRLAIAQGMQSMFAHGLERAATGKTSMEEVLRVTMAV